MAVKPKPKLVDDPRAQFDFEKVDIDDLFEAVDETYSIASQSDEVDELNDLGIDDVGDGLSEDDLKLPTLADLEDSDSADPDVEGTE